MGCTRSWDGWGQGMRTEFQQENVEYKKEDINLTLTRMIDGRNWPWTVSSYRLPGSSMEVTAKVFFILHLLGISDRLVSISFLLALSKN
jgi:hypothetical protein